MSPRTSRPPGILIVEDNYLLVEMLARLLGRYGVASLAASNGDGALAALRARGPAIDWLLMDIALPGPVDGRAVAAAYRALHPARPIVYASMEPRTAPRTAPDGLVVSKPFQLREITALARMMAGGHGEAWRQAG